jgi:asparagine synthase (glutamine-hydrolysing)
MSSGVEGREPFVGKKIFFESLKYNSYELINKKYGKIPLRRILSKFMGNKFSYGKKIGFPINVAKVFNINNKSNYKVWFQKNMEEIKKI